MIKVVIGWIIIIGSVCLAGCLETFNNLALHPAQWYGWGAAESKAVDSKAGNLSRAIGFKMQGLKAALEIFKRPSNTQLKIGGSKCVRD